MVIRVCVCVCVCVCVRDQLLEAGLRELNEETGLKLDPEDVSPKLLGLWEVRHTHTDTQADTQADRQTDRQVDRIINIYQSYIVTVQKVTFFSWILLLLLLIPCLLIIY